MRKLASLLLVCFLAIACTQNTPTKPSVVVTTNVLGDAVSHLLNDVDSIDVSVLMGPGVDPHLYKASQGDVFLLSNADLIVYHGLHLEGKMTELFAKLRDKETFEAGANIDHTQLINNSDFQGNHDPHIWFDPIMWSTVIDSLGDALQKQFPQYEEQISSNKTTLLSEIQIMHQQNLLSISNIPDSQRVLITAHDAFQYFARTYNMQVKSLQGLSTAAEYGIKDISNLVGFISERKIKAVFVESSVPTRSIEAVIEGCEAKGHTVYLGGELFSDALGGKGSGADTYVSMYLKNVKTISEALL